MDGEYTAETIEELIDSLLSQGGGGFTVAFDQTSITELNGTYPVTFVCILSERLPSQFGDVDVGPLPLTAEGEYMIQPSFEFTTKERDALLINSDLYRVATTDDRGSSASLGLLKTVCSEVHLDEEQLINLTEGNGRLHEPVQHIEVSSFSEEHHGMVAATQALASEQPHQRPAEPDSGINFLITIRGTHSHGDHINGLRVKKRFSHTETISIDGQRYPATITTVPFRNWTDSHQGQYIYTSNILAKNTDMPKIDLREEFNRINWGEFFASDRPWPESPQFALSR